MNLELTLESSKINQQNPMCPENLTENSTDKTPFKIDETVQSVIKSANEYYYQPSPQKLLLDRTEENDFEELAKLVKDDNIDDLQTSTTAKKHALNHNYKIFNNLLSFAYFTNKPKIVDWLLENGAADDSGVNFVNCKIPAIAFATYEYKDSRTRVVNELAQRYFDQCGASVKDPHILYEVMLKFAQEKNWRYCDSRNKGQAPFRDDNGVVFFGLPSLAYNVNCTSLISLFRYTAKLIGIDTTSVFYFNYQSISIQEKDGRGVSGDFRFFDESRSGPFKFEMHNVVQSEGYYFDLTLMCKYKNPNDILSVPARELPKDLSGVSSKESFIRYETSEYNTDPCDINPR